MCRRPGTADTPRAGTDGGVATAAAECSGSCLSMPFIYTRSLGRSFIQPVGFDSCSGSGWALGTPDTALAEIPVPRCSHSGDRTEGQEGASVSMFPDPRPRSGGLPAGSSNPVGTPSLTVSTMTDLASQCSLST